MPLKQATRIGVRPLVGLYGESGCGKSMSALLMARGFAGPDGRIGQIDSEEGRGSLYADVIPGGYETLLLTAPFTPQRYVDAIVEVENSGCKIGVLDSGSHEWQLGVLEMAGESEARSNKAGLNNWRKPKAEHEKFVLKLLGSRIPWIVCLRAKYKSRQIKDQNGKTQIIKDDCVTAIQSEEFLFEMTAHACVLPDHSIKLTKVSHPDLKSCFPKDGPITQEHGKLLAQWCANAGGGKVASALVNQPINSLGKLKKELFDLTRDRHQGDVQALEQFLIDEILIPDNAKLADLTSEEIANAINKYKAKFSK